MKKIVTFGEVMMRLAAPGNLRLRQSRNLDVTYAGAEANVAASISILGGNATYVTALPNNSLADACLDAIRGIGVNTDHVLRVDYGRLGLYFLEAGANQRPSQVIYDRDNSSVAMTPAESYNWEAIFAEKNWLHVSGITPALSRLAADSTIQAVKVARASGLRISCDLNFRAKLWKWEKSKSSRELAGEVMRKLLPFVDIVIANETDCGDVLGIHAEETDVHAGQIDTGRYPEVARQVIEQFSNVKQVAITLRENISASHNNWGAMLYIAEQNKSYFAPQVGGEYHPYQIKNIVDRVGGGDSFAAGLIFALNTPEFEKSPNAIDFAAASSCLAHSLSGDFNFSTRKEVETLMSGSASGRIIR